MITIDEIMVNLGLKKDQEAAEKFGRSIQAVSNWRREGMVPANIERMYNDMKVNQTTVHANGDGHHININHVADPHNEHYSPATSTLLDIIKDWSEKKRRKLLGIAIGWNGDEEEEE